MEKEKKALFIIFGGTGDLARRKLYPSLYRLFKKGYLKDHFAVIGTARREWSNEHYQDIVMETIQNIATSEEDALDFARHFRYQSHNVKDTEHYDTLLNLANELDEEYGLEQNRIFYLSMSPQFFGTISHHLKSQGLITSSGFNRVIIEKPFGEDYETALELNNEITEAFEEEQLYRIDHYLGKEMVLNIPALRFGNQFLESVWNNNYISNVQITLSEDIGVEERGGYYDNSGALRDMVQNHVLQVVSLLAMEEPEDYSNEEIRKAKTTLLESLKKYDDQEVVTNFVRGQYGSSEKDGEIVTGYREEEKVDPESQTETFVAGKMVIDTPRWEGVPFYIRTGKRMVDKVGRIDIQFKQKSDHFFQSATQKELTPNYLTINLGPEEGFSFQMNAKQAGPGMQPTQVSLAHRYSEEEIDNNPEAYEKLILDCLNGNSTNFIHWEELEASWKYIDTIRETWDKTEEEFPNYPAGSMGPKESDLLLEKDGFKWHWNPEPK